MNKTKLQVAIIEAKRFLAKAQAATVRMEVDKEMTFTFQGTKEDAACKRASMDLSRALSDLRKPEGVK